MRQYIYTVLVAIATGPSVAAQTPYPVDDADYMVRSWYARYLGSDINGTAQVQANALRQGVPPAWVLADIMGSPAYYYGHGGTPEAYVRALYGDLAGRQPMNRDLNQRVYQVNQHGRPWVAHRMLLRHPYAWQAP
jgi:hypothetical protein